MRCRLQVKENFLGVIEIQNLGKGNIRFLARLFDIKSYSEDHDRRCETCTSWPNWEVCWIPVFGCEIEVSSTAGYIKRQVDW